MRSAPKKREQARRVITERVSFPEFLEIWNIKQGQVTPLFHREIAEWLEATDGKATRLLMAFREASKSWLISAFCAWKLTIDPNQTFILISAVQDLATKNANFIREIIEQHPLTQHLVPVGEKELWQRQSFTVNRTKSIPDPTVQALTLFGDWTGRHSQYLFADDIETLANAETNESRESVRKRIRQFRSMSRKIMWIGTPHWGSQSLYQPLLDKPEYCDARQYPAWTEDADGNRTYTWPENVGVSDPESLELKEIDLGPAEFRSQYLLIPEDMNAGGLDLENVHVYSDAISKVTTSVWHSNEPIVRGTIGKYQLSELVCGWDPSNGRGDDSIVSLVAGSRDGHTFNRAGSGGSVRAFDSDVLSWRDAVVTNGGSVSLDRLIIVDAFVYAEKTAGLWTLTDDYLGFWAEGSVQALTSLKQRRLATAVNSPTFTADRDYTFDGVTNYIDTGFVPFNHAVAMTVSSAHVESYERTSLGVSSTSPMGVRSNSSRVLNLFPRSSGNTIAVSVNATSATFTNAAASAIRLSQYGRLGTGSSDLYAARDGVDQTLSTPGGTLGPSMATHSIWCGGLNNVGSFDQSRNASLGYVAWGAALDSAQRLARYNNVQAWATAVGAQV